MTTPNTAPPTAPTPAPTTSPNETAHTTDAEAIPITGAPSCPKCGGRMWDNRSSKRNRRAPDFKCRNRSCDGVLWPGQHKSAIPIFPPRPHYDAMSEPHERHANETRADQVESTSAVSAGAESEAREGSPLPPPSPDAPACDDPSPSRRQAYCAYLAATDFVFAHVRTIYQDAGVTCTDATLAEIVATLFAATCRTARRANP